MSYQVKAELDPLERDRREIERRRSRFEDRKSRILHAKTRVMGIDTDALQQQVEERKQREKDEQERDKYYDQQTLLHSKTMTGFEEQRKHNNRSRLMDLSDYRKQQQNYKQINDNTAKLSYTSYTLPSSDPLAATSAASSTVFLNFAGEDLSAATRYKAQQQQQFDSITSQLQSLTLKEQRNQQEEADYHYYQQQILLLQKSNEEKQKQSEADKRKQVQYYNLNLAAEKKEKEKQAKINEIQMNQYELNTTLRSAFLNEQPGPAGADMDFSTNFPSSSSRPSSSSALSASGCNVAYGFKGFSTSQKQSILNEQGNQQEYLKNQRLAAAEEEKEYASEQEQFRRESVRLERKRREEEANKRIELSNQRKQQDQEKQGRDHYFNKVVYTNPVSEEFFKQFGTSCR